LINPTPQNTQNQPQLRRNKRRNRLISSTQVTFAVIVAIGLMLAINFSTRINADRDLQQIRDTIEQEINFLANEQVELQQELQFAESDAFVEAWARSEGKMIREGDVLVVPVPSNIVFITPTPAFESDIVIETTLPQPDNWQLWWTLFFDDMPPDF